MVHFWLYQELWITILTENLQHLSPAGVSLSESTTTLWQYDQRRNGPVKDEPE
jgi:hypothetical protein